MLLSITAAVLLACCGPQSIAPVSAFAQWPQPGMNPAHTGYNPFETILGSGNVGKLAQVWSFSTGGRIAAPIVVNDGVAYVNSADGYLYAVNVRTGKQVWKFQTFTGSGVQYSAIVSGAHVFVGCLVAGNARQNGICALRTAGGAPIWHYFLASTSDPPAGIAGAPAALGGTLLVPYYQSSSGGKSVLQVLNADTGKPQWRYVYAGSNGGGPSPAAPAIANGAVYVGEQGNHSVCSVNLTTHQEDWCLPTGDDYNSIAVWKNVVYVNTYDHGVFAFNASTASQMWNYTPSSGNYSGTNDPPAVAGGTVYVAGVGFGGNLYAIDAASGRLRYSASPASGSTQSSPSLANGIAYAACDVGVCAFDAATGASLNAFGTAGDRQSPPVIVNGVVVAACGPNAACAYAVKP